MKIAILGPGAMGLLYGAKLSVHNEVILLGNNKDNIKLINQNGIILKRNDNETKYNPKAFLNGEYNEIVDLVIILTKALSTRKALEDNKNIIGKKTYILSLQNGAGHDAILKEYQKPEYILLGTTAQASFRENPYTIVNTGLGDTFVGSIIDNDVSFIKDIFEASDFPTVISNNILFNIWNKLMINASSSVLSGVLNSYQGYIVENSNAWNICKNLICEICKTANSIGLSFDSSEQIERLSKHLNGAKMGIPSIVADLRNNRKTEIDFISGYVSRIAKENNVDTPYTNMVVDIIHSLEGKNE